MTPIQKKYYKAIDERNTAFWFKGSTNHPLQNNLMDAMMELRRVCHCPFSNS